VLPVGKSAAVTGKIPASLTRMDLVLENVDEERVGVDRIYTIAAYVARDRHYHGQNVDYNYLDDQFSKLAFYYGQERADAVKNQISHLIEIEGMLCFYEHLTNGELETLGW
jgi:hypothetical protein